MSNETREKIESFHSQVNKLKPYYDSFKNLGCQLECGEDKGRVRLTGPTEECLMAILMRFRILYMKESRISFQSTANVILEAEEYAIYHEKTHAFLEAWNKLLDKKITNYGGMSIGINGSELNPRKNFDTWFNEEYFHAENYKKGSGKGLDLLRSDGAVEGMSRFLMLSLLQDLCLCVLAFNHQIVESILD